MSFVRVITLLHGIIAKIQIPSHFHLDVGQNLTNIYTLNESYNLPPYILAASSDNKSKASTNFSFVQRVNSCQNSSSNFISKRSQLLE